MKKISLLSIFLLLLLCIGLFMEGCKNEDEYSGFVEGFIVGSFECNNSDNRGFCIILENNTDSLYTFSLSDNIFDFPPAIIKPGYDVYTGGPYFFPDSFRNSFKLKFKFRQPVKSEISNCTLLQLMLGPSFLWEKWNYVIIEDFDTISN